MAIEPNAIFQQNHPESQSTPTFLGKLRRISIRSLNRVCFYKYIRILHRSQIFLWFFLKTELTQKNLTEPLKIIKINCQPIIHRGRQ